MPEYHSFSDEAISRALETAQRPHADKDLRALSQISTTENPVMRLSAECISLTSGDHQVCLNLPLGLGSFCLPLPFDLPDGTAVQACLDICTTWGIPTGVCVKVSAGGTSLVQQCFGFNC